MNPPTGVKVTHPPHNAECWQLTIGARALLWRFHPAAGGKKPHAAFVTFEGSPFGPVSAEDMDALAATATAVAERMRADRQRDTAGDQPVLFDLEGAS